MEGPMEGSYSYFLIGMTRKTWVMMPMRWMRMKKSTLSMPWRAMIARSATWVSTGPRDDDVDVVDDDDYDYDGCGMDHLL